MESPSTQINSLLEPLLLKVKKKLASWKATLLSQGGRLILIKHVFSSIPMHIRMLPHPQPLHCCHLFFSIHIDSHSLWWVLILRSQQFDLDCKDHAKVREETPSHEQGTMEDETKGQVKCNSSKRQESAQCRKSGRHSSASGD